MSLQMVIYNIATLFVIPVVNKIILFMAPRMVYCNIIKLTLEFNVEDEYDVSIRQLWTLFTYWCHVCCLIFWRDNLVVDGRQMVSLFKIGALCFMYMASFTFLLCQLDSWVSILVFFMDTS